MMDEKYELEITMRLRKTGPNGGYPSDFEMSERATLGTLNFLELTKVLGQFHDVANAIRESHGES